MANQEQTIALAGIFQALSLVNSIAHRGMVDMTYYGNSVKSILALDADSTLDIFGGDVDNIKLGLVELVENFKSISNSEKSMEITSYLINIMVLERKLSANQELLAQIGNGINRAKSQLKHFEATDEKIATILAQTYKNTISNTSPKIMVRGENQHLNNSHHADKIRTMLLGAVRSAVLWRQRGGKRLRLVFDRTTISKIAYDLLS